MHTISTIKPESYCSALAHVEDRPLDGAGQRAERERITA
jgi:hypothetical protein